MKAAIRKTKSLHIDKKRYFYLHQNLTCLTWKKRSDELLDVAWYKGYYEHLLH